MLGSGGQVHKRLRPKAPNGHPTSTRLLHEVTRSHPKSPMQGNMTALASSPDKGRQAARCIHWLHRLRLTAPTSNHPARAEVLEASWSSLHKHNQS